jgi:hypothetical protein
MVKFRTNQMGRVGGWGSGLSVQGFGSGLLCMDLSSRQGPMFPWLGSWVEVGSTWQDKCLFCVDSHMSGREAFGGDGGDGTLFGIISLQ